MDSVYVVLLRRPRSEAGEMRSDPFWEFGSFGSTGCHHSNLMQAKNAEALAGARFAFAQGGSEGFRLVYLTPPIKIEKHLRLIEARWSKGEMPFRYALAPVLASNKSIGEFPLLESEFLNIARTTSEGKFASRFRACATPLNKKVAIELIRVYSDKRKKATASMLAVSYDDALPKQPPTPDPHRKRTYRECLRTANVDTMDSQLEDSYKENASMNRRLAKEIPWTESCVVRAKKNKC